MPNAAPVAYNVSASVHSGNSVFIAPSFTDADGDIVAVDSATSPSHGGVGVIAEGVTYQPAYGFSGTDSFTYTITDSNGGVSTATMTVTVWNTAPIGENLNSSVHAGQGVWLTPSLTDVDGDTVVIDSATTPLHGGLTVYIDGIYYQPSSGFVGTDSFDYTITDSNGSYATYAVTIEVTNTDPVADDVSENVNAGQSVLVTPSMTDADGDVASIASVAQPANGSVWNYGSYFIYTPNQGFIGTESFEFTVTDSQGGESTGNVILVVSDGEFGSITGIVWYDDNGDGISSNTEYGLEYIDVYLFVTVHRF